MEYAKTEINKEFDDSLRLTFNVVSVFIKNALPVKRNFLTMDEAKLYESIVAVEDFSSVEIIKVGGELVPGKVADKILKSVYNEYKKALAIASDVE